MAKRSKLAPRTKTGSAKTKAEARRRLAARKRKPPLRPKLKVGANTAAPASKPDKDTGALQALTALLSSLPSLALGAAGPAMRVTEQALGQIDIAKYVGALTAAMPDEAKPGARGNAKSAKRQLAEEAALLAAAIALIALRRKLPLKKIIGSGVPGNVLSLLGSLRSLKK